MKIERLDIGQTVAPKTITIYFLVISFLGGCASVRTLSRSPAEANAACMLSIEEENSLLSLDYKAFDQNLPSGGFRSLSSRGCCREAAQLVAKYRVQHAKTLKPFDSCVLAFHAGQLFTKAGDKELGLEMVRQAIDPAYADDPKDTWNLFVRGTIAFLENDMSTLRSIHAQYSELRETNKSLPYGMDAIEHLMDSAQKGEGYGTCESTDEQ